MEHAAASPKKEGEGGGLEDEDNEEDEKAYEEDGMGTKRKLEAKRWTQNKAVTYPRISVLRVS